MKPALALAGLFVLLGGCGSAPHWSDARTDLDRVPLSVWAAPQKSGELFVVGGPLGSAGQTLFMHRDGDGWHEEQAGTTVTLWWVFGRSSSDVWAAGEGGTILHWDGAQLSTETVPTSETLFGVWGPAEGDELWAVGGRPDIDGVILHRVAGAWSAVGGLPATGTYFKVWGAAADDVYACGQGGTIMHYDGTSWNAQTTGLQSFISLFTVAGPLSSGSEVYSVGGQSNGVAIHRVAGGDWKLVDDPALAEVLPLAGVAVAADGTVAMVGAGGTKLRGRPGHLADESEQATRADFHAVSFADGSSSELWAVGGNWLAPPPTARKGVVVRFGD